VTVCLDAYALIGWAQDEPFADAVESYLSQGRRGNGERCLMSALNLGEVYYRLARLRGPAVAGQLWEEARAGALGIAIVEATLPRVRAAASHKAQHAISYADAFAVATAVEHRAPLLTGDPEILALEGMPGLEVVALVPE
jgi:predicted nucleic acid-binding protein